MAIIVALNTLKPISQLSPADYYCERKTEASHGAAQSREKTIFKPKSPADDRETEKNQKTDEFIEGHRNYSDKTLRNRERLSLFVHAAPALAYRKAEHLLQVAL
jgi:hypothetical protein